MKCLSAQPDLKAYCDGELSPLRRMMILRHLSRCTACREEIKIMEQITKSLEATHETAPLSEALRNRILAGVQPTPALRATPPETGGAREATIANIPPPVIGGRMAKPGGGPSAQEGGQIPGVRGNTSRHRLNLALVTGACAGLALICLIILPVLSRARQEAMEPAGLMRAQGFDRTADGTAAVKSLPQHAAVAPKPSAPYTYTGGFAGETSNNSVATLGQASAPPPMATPADQMMSPDLSVNRRVHREANLTVQTKNPEDASSVVEQRVKDAGGFVASNELTTDSAGMKSAQMVVKVPVAQFDTMLGQIEKLGDVQEKDVTGEDITGKVSDATQAEAVLEDEVNRSNAHLAALGRHARWQDEEDAREIRIELAQARAREVLLHKLADLANITVNLTQAPTAPAQTGLLSNLRSNGAAALQSMAGALSMLLTMIVWIVAFVPIWGPIAFAIWYGARARRRSGIPGA